MLCSSETLEEQMQYGQSELGIHRDSTGETLIDPVKKGISVTSHNTREINTVIQEQFWEAEAVHTVQGMEDDIKGTPPLHTASSSKNSAHATPDKEKSLYNTQHLNKRVARQSMPEYNPELLQLCKKLKEGEMLDSQFSLKECIIQASTKTLNDAEMSATAIPTTGGRHALGDAAQRAMEVPVAEARLSTEAAAQSVEKRLEKLPAERGRLKGTAACTKDPIHITNTSETQVGGTKAAIQKPDASGGMVDEAVQRAIEVPVAGQGLPTQGKEPDSFGGVVHEAVQRAPEVPVAEKGRLSTYTAAQSMEKGKENRGGPEKTASDSKVPTQDARMSMVPVENQGLPFFKSLPLWEEVESMEVFQLLPQRPHFTPLKQYKELLREGMAIGYMLSFASLVEKTCKLQHDDPRSMLENILEALVELETLGFEVNPVRFHLQELLKIKDQELLKIKDRQLKLKVQARVVEGQIIETKHASSILHTELDEIDRKMKEQQQYLSMLYKKLASLMAPKEINCSYVDPKERVLDLIKKKF